MKAFLPESGVSLFLYFQINPPQVADFPLRLFFIEFLAKPNAIVASLIQSHSCITSPAKESGKVIYVSPKDGYGAKWDVYNSEDEFVESVPIMPQDVKDKRYEVLLNAVMRNEKLKNAINGLS